MGDSTGAADCCYRTSNLKRRNVVVIVAAKKAAWLDLRCPCLDVAKNGFVGVLGIDVHNIKALVVKRRSCNAAVKTQNARTLAGFFYSLDTGSIPFFLCFLVDVSGIMVISYVLPTVDANVSMRPYRKNHFHERASSNAYFNKSASQT